MKVNHRSGHSQERSDEDSACKSEGKQMRRFIAAARS